MALKQALEELEKTKEKRVYKAVGNILIQEDTVKVKKELEEKLQMLKIRINSIEKQEAKIREKAEELQKEVLSELEKKNDSKTSGKHK